LWRPSGEGRYAIREGGKDYGGAYEGLRYGAAQKEIGRKAFFLARLKPCPTNRDIENFSVPADGRAGVLLLF
jgi:hypothetical protein